LSEEIMLERQIAEQEAILKWKADYKALWESIHAWESLPPWEKFANLPPVAGASTASADPVAHIDDKIETCAQFESFCLKWQYPNQ